MLRSNLTLLVILVVSTLAMDSRRPFFMIGHMVNSIEEVEKFVTLDCNVLESDVQFFPDGSVQMVYHDGPCDLGRYCHKATKLDDYLDYIQEVTDSTAKKRYHEKLVMVFLDLKLGGSFNKTRSGEDVAIHLLEYLWASGRSQVKVLMYIESELNKDFIIGFIHEINRLEFGFRLNDIGFDAGVGDLDKNRIMFENINSHGYFANVWQGDGTTNVLRDIHGEEKLQHLVSVRDSPSSFFHKVYDWTVDKKLVMRRSLRLGVDGMMTNDPKSLSEVLREPEFKGLYRMATIEDDPFVRFGTATVVEVPYTRFEE